MYFSTIVCVLLAATECIADSAEPYQASLAQANPMASVSLSEALKVDDTCVAEPCGTALLQTRALPQHGVSETQVEGGVVRRPAKVAPKPNNEKWIFFQESVPGQWGDVLDAGTGPSSLTWLAACPVGTITAVTANESAVKSTTSASGDFLDPKLDKVIAGNWQDPEFLQGQKFDVVVADWLLGSVEAFAPHFQVGLMRRLTKLVKPGGWLLFSGREPDNVSANSTVGARMLLDIDALRDAATTLSLRHPYREVPQWWVEEQLGAMGFKVHKRHVEALDLDPDYVFGQLEWAGDEIKKVRDKPLRAALEARSQALKRDLVQSKSVWQKQSSGKVYAIVGKLP